MGALSKWQQGALTALARENPHAKVVGWDDASDGPLVEVGFNSYVSISRRGRWVERPNYHRCHCGRVHGGECAGVSQLPEGATCR